MDKTFTVGESLKEGWRLTKEYLGFLLIYQIIFYTLVALFAVSPDQGIVWKSWHLVGWVIVVLAKMGLYNSTLQIAANIKPFFSELYKNWRLFLSWIVANFLFGLMLAIGLILFIVPGCYILARYGLFPFFILDKNLGPIEALKQASKASEGVRWPLFLLFLACFGLDLLGFILLGVGLLLTVPVTLIALAYVYRRITGQQERQIEKM